MSITVPQPYACPFCAELFTKWSLCHMHLRSSDICNMCVRKETDDLKCCVRSNSSCGPSHGLTKLDTRRLLRSLDNQVTDICRHHPIGHRPGPTEPVTQQDLCRTPTKLHNDYHLHDAILKQYSVELVVAWLELKPWAIRERNTASDLPLPIALRSNSDLVP